MRLEIRRFHEAFGITTLYVTHDQAQAMAISDRIARLRAGRVVQAGSSEDLFLRPRTGFVAEFIGRTRALEATAVGADMVARGSLRLRVTADGLSPGAAVTLSVRPHDIAAGPAGAPPAPGQNRVVGVVRRISYLGSRLDFEVGLEGADAVFRVRGRRQGRGSGPGNGSLSGFPWRPVSPWGSRRLTTPRPSCHPPGTAPISLPSPRPTAAPAFRGASWLPGGLRAGPPAADLQARGATGRGQAAGALPGPGPGPAGGGGPPGGGTWATDGR